MPLRAALRSWCAGEAGDASRLTRASVDAAGLDGGRLCQLSAAAPSLLPLRGLAASEPAGAPAAIRHSASVLVVGVPLGSRAGICCCACCVCCCCPGCSRPSSSSCLRSERCAGAAAGVADGYTIDKLPVADRTFVPTAAAAFDAGVELYACGACYTVSGAACG